MHSIDCTRFCSQDRPKVIKPGQTSAASEATPAKSSPVEQVMSH